MTPETLGYAFLGGLLPSFIWLYFLLKEDATHPEPKKLIALAFIAGMIAVPLAFHMQIYAKEYVSGDFSTFTAWALIEELLKYLMAALFILWRRAVDEAPDYVMYMITVALGFAAAENMLYIFSALEIATAAIGPTLSYATTFITGNVRFIGANLLHLVASGIIGFALAFSYKYGPGARVFAATLGIILATTLHTAFNLLIIAKGASTMLSAFSLVWIGAVVFFADFEVLKYIQYPRINIKK